MDLSLLPPEVLSNIFAFLPIEDRKNVRLVCEHWKLCCNCPAIINREKFCFRSDCSIESIDSFLQTCEQLRSTIEFQDLKLGELPSENTWRLIGEKIHSLSFTECRISEISNELTKNIILYCQNLESYKLTQFLYSGDIVNFLFSPEILDELIQLNIERRKMLSFEVVIGCQQLPDNILEKIFKIFSCIQTYSTGEISYMGFQPYCQHDIHFCGCICQRMMETIPNMHTLQDFINPSSIKELTINLLSNCLWLRKLTDVPQLKLRKLETMCTSQSESDSTLDNLIHFLHHQSELQILKIGWVESKDEAERLLFQILSACPELVDLRLKSEMPLNMNSFFKILQKISKSKLECIVLGFKPICNPNDEVIDPPTPFTNKILHTLKFINRSDVIPENYCLPLLKHFCHLRRLEIAVASDKVLQTIFQYHIHLQRLVLQKIGNCTAFGFTGQSSCSMDFCGDCDEEEINYSISRLSKLEHLEVDGFLEHCYVEKMLKEFCFPRLTYLRLSLWGLTEKVSYEFLCTAIPLVEVLKIDGVCLCEDQLLSFCRQMPRLKLLHGNLQDDNFVTVKQLFAMRPSLKYIIECDDECDNNVNKFFYFAYFFDRVTKTIFNAFYNKFIFFHDHLDYEV